MELSKFLEYMKDFYPMPIIYPLYLIFAKMSLMIFYTRLSPVRVYQIAAWFGVFIALGSNISLTFATTFPCRPLEVAWDPLLTGTCIDRSASYKATAILGLVLDVYLIVLPIPIVVGLQMHWQQKVGLIAMFAVGIV
ncbi:hypothetical protein BX600DRAFT_436472 [Xylariales sp. PMI_506]|nr:hypothetical protein BX600DRAFT_436472 [Xylariales sp. PMI_506]